MDFTHGDGEFFFFPVVIFLRVLTNRVVTSELQATIIDVFKVVGFFVLSCPNVLRPCRVTNCPIAQ